MFFTIALLLSGTVLWQYMSSFTEVVFEYSPRDGSVKLTGADGTVLHPAANTATRLKLGEYTISRSGDGVNPEPQKLVVTPDLHRYSVNFSLTDDILAAQLATQQSAITRIIEQTYPRIPELYTISHQQLYGKGDWFGATLHHIDATNQNRDTLHILLQRSGDDWKVISKPPQPVLTKALYPEAPIHILKRINQEK